MTVSSAVRYGVGGGLLVGGPLVLLAFALAV
jgi:hypothetical protein